MELLLIFGGVYAAFLIGRVLQYLSDARNVMGKGDGRDRRRR